MFLAKGKILVLPLLAAMLWTCLAVVTPVTPVRAEQDPKLDGTWLLTSTNNPDLNKDALEVLKIKIEIKDDKYEYFRGDKKIEAGTFKLEPAKKPAAVDITVLEGKDKGQTRVGVYTLKGDTLTLGFNENDLKVRPKNFQRMDGIFVGTFKRAN